MSAHSHVRVRKYMGALLFWAGALLLLVSAFSGLSMLAQGILSESNRLGSLLAVLAGMIGVALSRVVLAAGKRLAQESAAARLGTDHRPPVLLLRAFRADGEVAEHNWFNQRSLFGWLFGRATFEEQLANIMENLGPPVALGRGGEVLPHRGFARQYTDNYTWRSVVDNYLTNSSWVVILLQEVTPNLIYEIQRSLASGPLLKALLIPPPPHLRTAAWHAAWSSLTAGLPILPRITDLTAAVLIDPKGGVIDIPMPANSSANTQLLAVQRALIPKYLVSRL